MCLIIFSIIFKHLYIGIYLNKENRVSSVDINTIVVIRIEPPSHNYMSLTRKGMAIIELNMRVIIISNLHFDVSLFTLKVAENRLKIEKKSIVKDDIIIINNA